MMTANETGTVLGRDTSMCGDPKSWYLMRVLIRESLLCSSLNPMVSSITHFAAWLTFVESCKLQKKAALEVFNGYTKLFIIR